eukprot:scaffold111846_cov29-Tisochrysis_lutea.AAC.2
MRAPARALLEKLQTTGATVGNEQRAGRGAAHCRRERKAALFEAVPGARVRGVYVGVAHVAARHMRPCVAARTSRTSRPGGSRAARWRARPLRAKPGWSRLDPRRACRAPVRRWAPRPPTPAPPPSSSSRGFREAPWTQRQRGAPRCRRRACGWRAGSRSGSSLRSPPSRLREKARAWACPRSLSHPPCEQAKWALHSSAVAHGV